MLINEQGIKDAVQRRQEDENHQLKECKQLLLDTLNKMITFEEKFQNIFETFNYCKENRVTDLLPTLLDVDNIYIHIRPDYINDGKYEIVEFNTVNNTVYVKWWPLRKWVVIQHLSALTGVLCKLEARVHQEQLMLVNTPNSTFKYIIKETSVKSFLNQMPKIVKKATDTIINKLNEIK